MLKLDDKTNEFLNKVVSMKGDFEYLLNEICKKLDKGDCDKLKKGLMKPLLILRT